MEKKRILEENELHHKLNKKHIIYVDTIKYTLKQYKLPCKGKKQDLLNTLIQHYKDKHYKQNIDKIIFVQKQFRNRYDKITPVNSEDFYTLESLNKIEKHFLFCYVDKNKFKYGFDIRSINILIEKSNINPYNRTIIPSHVIINIKEKIQELKNKNISVAIEEEITYTDEQRLNNKIINIFQKIDILEIAAGGTNISWFNGLDFSGLKKLYRTLEDIWNYRAEIGLAQKHQIIPGNNIFKYNLTYIINLTPNYSFYLKNIILDEINKLVTSGIDNESKKLGAYYVLIGFTEVSPDCAQSLPWLSQS